MRAVSRNKFTATTHHARSRASRRRFPAGAGRKGARALRALRYVRSGLSPRTSAPSRTPYHTWPRTPRAECSDHHMGTPDHTPCPQSSTACAPGLIIVGTRGAWLCVALERRESRHARARRDECRRPCRVQRRVWRTSASFSSVRSQPAVRSLPPRQPGPTYRHLQRVATAGRGAPRRAAPRLPPSKNGTRGPKRASRRGRVCAESDGRAA